MVYCPSNRNRISTFYHIQANITKTADTIFISYHHTTSTKALFQLCRKYNLSYPTNSESPPPYTDNLRSKSGLIHLS